MFKSQHRQLVRVESLRIQSDPCPQLIDLGHMSNNERYSKAL